jgi:hypothetical protein
MLLLKEDGFRLLRRSINASNGVCLLHTITEAKENQESDLFVTNREVRLSMPTVFFGRLR